MEPLAQLEDLLARLDWTLDEDERRIATSALEDASDEARSHGRDWPPDRVPRLARTLVLKACVRYMRNPDGYVTSKAGDETLTWTDRGAGSGSPEFTDAEIKLLRSLGGGNPSIVSAPITAWGPQRRHPRHMLPEPGYVPVDYGGDPFPLYPSPDGPW